MKLSVIIPVYKAEHTLNRCVESVLGQNVPEMEVILVDDGSPDRCPRMCDEWSKTDHRIKVIHQENSGPGSARNVGIDIAKGEYITFVDSDDYISPGTYQYMLSEMNKTSADILEYSLEQRDISRIPLRLSDETFISAQKYWLDTRAWLHAYPCNKFYKREIIGIDRFPHMSICEDLIFLARIVKKSKRIITTKQGLYIYEANGNGLSKKIDISTIAGALFAEIIAAYTMRTMPWSKNGWSLYYQMGCRLYDILRLSLGIKIK